MASPAPREFKVWMKGRQVCLVHKRRRSRLGVGAFWHHTGPRGRGQTLALSHSQKCGSGGQSPSKCHSGSFHHTRLSLCQNRFPKFMWGPVYFSFFFFLITIVLRSVFLLAKVTVGPTLCGVSCLLSPLKPLSQSSAQPRRLSSMKAGLDFPLRIKNRSQHSPSPPVHSFKCHPDLVIAGRLERQGLTALGCIKLYLSKQPRVRNSHKYCDMLNVVEGQHWARQAPWQQGLHPGLDTVLV